MTYSDAVILTSSALFKNTRLTSSGSVKRLWGANRRFYLDVTVIFGIRCLFSPALDGRVWGTTYCWRCLISVYMIWLSWRKYLLFLSLRRSDKVHKGVFVHSSWCSSHEACLFSRQVADHLQIVFFVHIECSHKLLVYFLFWFATFFSTFAAIDFLADLQLALRGCFTQIGHGILVLLLLHNFDLIVIS